MYVLYFKTTGPNRYIIWWILLLMPYSCQNMKYKITLIDVYFPNYARLGTVCDMFRITANDHLHWNRSCILPPVTAQRGIQRWLKSLFFLLFFKCCGLWLHRNCGVLWTQLASMRSLKCCALWPQRTLAAFGCKCKFLAKSWWDSIHLKMGRI